MANTKAKKDVKKPDVVKEVIKPEIKKVATKKVYKLNQDVSLKVVSCYYGRLTYVNEKTGDKYFWSHCGEEQVLRVSDITAMKATQRKFFEDNWIAVVGVEDPSADLEGITEYELNKALNIDRYYTETFNPSNIGSVFELKPSEIEDKLRKMPEGVRENIVIRANEMAATGELYDIRIIKAIENATGLDIKLSFDN